MTAPACARSVRDYAPLKRASTGLSTFRTVNPKCPRLQLLGMAIVPPASVKDLLDDDIGESVELPRRRFLGALS